MSNQKQNHGFNTLQNSSFKASNVVNDPNMKKKLQSMLEQKAQGLTISSSENTINDIIGKNSTSSFFDGTQPAFGVSKNVPQKPAYSSFVSQNQPYQLKQQMSVQQTASQQQLGSAFNYPNNTTQHQQNIIQPMNRVVNSVQNYFQGTAANTMNRQGSAQKVQYQDNFSKQTQQRVVKGGYTTVTPTQTPIQQSQSNLRMEQSQVQQRQSMQMQYPVNTPQNNNIHFSKSLAQTISSDETVLGKYRLKQKARKEDCLMQELQQEANSDSNIEQRIESNESIKIIDENTYNNNSLLSRYLRRDQQKSVAQKVLPQTNYTKNIRGDSGRRNQLLGQKSDHFDQNRFYNALKKPIPNQLVQTPSQITGSNSVLFNKNTQIQQVQGKSFVELEDSSCDEDVSENAVMAALEDNSVEETFIFKPNSKQSDPRKPTQQIQQSNTNTSIFQNRKQVNEIKQNSKNFYGNLFDKNVSKGKLIGQPLKSPMSKQSPLKFPVQKKSSSSVNAVDRFKERHNSSGLKPYNIDTKRSTQHSSTGQPNIDIVKQAIKSVNPGTKRFMKKHQQLAEESKEKDEKKKEVELKLRKLKNKAEKLMIKKRNEEQLGDLLGYQKTQKPTDQEKEYELQKLLEDGNFPDISQMAQSRQEKSENRKPLTPQEIEEQQRQIQEENEKKFAERQRQIQLEQEEKQRMIRFHQRKRIDELIKPILSLELVDEFFEKNPKEVLDGICIPDAFQDHMEYMDMWIPLFLYETYNQLISQRSGGVPLDIDASLAAQLLVRDQNQSRKQFSFEAQIEKEKTDIDYVHLKIYENDNVKGYQNQKGHLVFDNLDKLREHDLLMFSLEKFDIFPGQSVKKKCNAEYLHKLLKKEDKKAFLGLVIASRNREHNYVQVKVDAAFVDKFFSIDQVQLFKDKKPLQCHYFDSLMTIVREFRTIKSCEFYKTGKIILNPKKALKEIEKQGQDLDDELTKRVKSKMLRFVENQTHNFNQSQHMALRKVAEMRQKDLLLIQGPPGTGKTHTIHGITTMLQKCQGAKILICTPSNCAIDEIVQRLTSDKGIQIFGQILSQEGRNKGGQGGVIRVGAMEYEPLGQVKRHTLDFKLDQMIKEQLFNSSSTHKSALWVQQEGKSSIEFTFKQPGFMNLTDQDSTKLQNKERFGSTNINCDSSKTSKTQIELKKIEDEKRLQIGLIKEVMDLLRIYGVQLISGQKMQQSEKSVQDRKIEQKMTQLLCTDAQVDLFMQRLTRKEKIDLLERQRIALVQTDQKSVAQFRAAHRNTKTVSYEAKQNMIKRILNDAQVICTTLAMSASEMFKHFPVGVFDYLIVDEACQTVELTNLIPFCHQPKKIILVGDHKQLPATVFSENGQRTRYSRSMFERFLDCDIQTFMLQIQYRMNRAIRQFPSDQFYEGKLEDAQSVTEREIPENLKSVSEKLNLQATMFFDIADSKETKQETSKKNLDEVAFVENLLILLAKFNVEKGKQPSLANFKNQIGIISPYKSQTWQLKQSIVKLRHKLGLTPQEANDPSFIEVNTVDAFQGKEKEIIIISTVRTDGLGFLNDQRRMNVAITRAKNFLWVVGNKSNLQKNHNWRSWTNSDSICKTYSISSKNCRQSEFLEEVFRQQNDKVKIDDFNLKSNQVVSEKLENKINLEKHDTAKQNLNKIISEDYGLRKTVIYEKGQSIVESPDYISGKASQFPSKRTMKDRQEESSSWARQPNQSSFVPDQFEDLFCDQSSSSSSALRAKKRVQDDFAQFASSESESANRKQNVTSFVAINAQSIISQKKPNEPKRHKLDDKFSCLNGKSNSMSKDHPKQSNQNQNNNESGIQKFNFDINSRKDSSKSKSYNLQRQNESHRKEEGRNKFKHYSSNQKSQRRFNDEQKDWHRQKGSVNTTYQWGSSDKGDRRGKSNHTYHWEGARDLPKDRRYNNLNGATRR